MPNRKAVVVEAGKGWAVILLPGGEYKRIKTNRYLEAGDLYQVNKVARVKYLAAAAIFLIILLGSIDYYTVQAYAEVSSLELGINRWGRVVSVEARDAEGQRILETAKIKNEPLENAVEKISRAIKEEKPDRQGVGKPSLSVNGKGKAKQELKQKMLEKMNKGLQRATPEKNKDAAKVLKNDAESQKSNINDLNNRNKQGNMEDPKVKQNHSKTNPEFEHPGLGDQAGKPALSEDLPLSKNDLATEANEDKQTGNTAVMKKNNENGRKKQSD
ncbi:MAG: hypothetical protein PHX14_09595 [Syntrophomonadaceae bacterium]|nr:hypothetical protein [Syntrophomonadaceae bacterium]